MERIGLSTASWQDRLPRAGARGIRFDLTGATSCTAMRAP
jgi:hypothetical protein